MHRGIYWMSYLSTDNLKSASTNPHKQYLLKNHQTLLSQVVQLILNLLRNLKAILLVVLVDLIHFLPL